MKTAKDKKTLPFGFCNQSLVPVRSEPSHRAEMCNQLLFGDLFAVLETFEGWLQIRLAYDNYEGWINRSSFCGISEAEFKRLNELSCHISTELVQLIENRSIQAWFPILLGSSLHGLEHNSFSAGDHEYFFEGMTDSIPQAGQREKILEMSMMYLHTPYCWGGRSPFGIDCSGFTQMAYKLAGVHLLRDSSQQATQGETISFISDAKAGDLLFFDDEEGAINHVGILMPEGKIIHASGKVRIDKVDHQGIFNVETKAYSHQLRLIKKIL
jgi:hypothetical protein